ncbi:hypothetical protein BH10PSE18_BH10PSE18_21910 [soil metagenome]
MRNSTTTRASSNAAGTLSDTVLDRVARLYLAHGALSANARRDVNLVSARLIANGDITLAATTVTARSLSLNAADGRGNVNLPVQQSTLESSHTSRGSSTFWESASGSGVQSETANHNSSISAMPAR